MSIECGAGLIEFTPALVNGELKGINVVVLLAFGIG